MQTALDSYLTMADESSGAVWHVVFALGAGALIGLERGYHGRPAGFRTHALVCMASSSCGC